MVLRLGLIVSALMFLYVTWASWTAGYYAEIALLRGLLAFIAVSFIAYLGELVVATMPPSEEEAAGSDDETEEEDEAEQAAGGAREETSAVDLARDAAAPATELQQADASNVISLEAARAARDEARQKQGQAA